MVADTASMTMAASQEKVSTSRFPRFGFLCRDWYGPYGDMAVRRAERLIRWHQRRPALRAAAGRYAGPDSFEAARAAWHGAHIGTSMPLIRTADTDVPSQLPGSSPCTSAQRQWQSRRSRPRSPAIAA